MSIKEVDCMLVSYISFILLQYHQQSLTQQKILLWLSLLEIFICDTRHMFWWETDNTGAMTESSCPWGRHLSRHHYYKPPPNIWSFYWHHFRFNHRLVTYFSSDRASIIFEKNENVFRKYQMSDGGWKENIFWKQCFPSKHSVNYSDLFAFWTCECFLLDFKNVKQNWSWQKYRTSHPSLCVESKARRWRNL